MENPLGELMFGALLIGVGYFFKKKGKDMAANGIEATAKVVDNVFADDLSYPVVEFTNHHKEVITKKLNSGYRPAKKVGTEIKIIYMPNDQDDIVVNSKFLYHNLPLLLFVLGGFSALYNIYKLATH